MNPRRFITGNVKNNDIAIVHAFGFQIGGQVSSSIDKYLRKAELHIKSGEVVQAEILYKKVLSKFPKNIKAIQGYQKLKTPPQAEIDRLISLFNNNRFRAAISLGTTLTEQFPGAVLLYEILGAANMGLGNTDETIINYQKVLQIKPEHTDAYNNLGMVFYELGKFSEAVKLYQKAVKIEPGFADAHYNLGNALKQTGDLRKAIKSYSVSFTINPNDVEVLREYGNALKDYGEFEQAIEYYKKVLKIDHNIVDIQTSINEAIKEKTEVDAYIRGQIKQDVSIPETAQFMHLMAINLYEKGNIEKSLENLKTAIEIYPDYADAYVTSAILLSKIGETERSIDNYKKAIKIQPDHAQAYNNLATILKEIGEVKSAIDNYRHAIKINPIYGIALSNLGSALQEIGEIDAAIESYDEALKFTPDGAGLNFNQSLALLYNRDFKSGWAKFEWRWKTESSNSIFLETTKPRWSPPGNNRVLLWAEQGIGDEIMFASLISDLYPLCAKLVVQVDKRLIPLFRRSFPNDIEFRQTGEVVSETEYDAHIPMGSLPQHFRQTIDSFKPASKGWLSACDVKTSSLRKKLLSDGSETLIGISWHSTKPRRGAENKLITLRQIAKSLYAPKVKLINLQYGEVNDELNRLRKELDIDVIQVHEIDNKNDIDDLAALIMACDKVISISNVTIHLAGALGKEAQVLLAFASDWRWGYDCNNSHWYDSVKLHRQAKIGDWNNILKQLSS